MSVESRYFGIIVLRPVVDGPALKCACGATFQYGEPGPSALRRYTTHAIAHNE